MSKISALIGIRWVRVPILLCVGVFLAPHTCSSDLFGDLGTEKRAEPHLRKKLPASRTLPRYINTLPQTTMKPDGGLASLSSNLRGSSMLVWGSVLGEVG